MLSAPYLVLIGGFLNAVSAPPWFSVQPGGPESAVFVILSHVDILTPRGGNFQLHGHRFQLHAGLAIG